MTSFISEFPGRTWFNTRTSRLLLLIGVGLLYCFGFAFHGVVTLVGVPAAPGTAIFYDALIILSYFLLYVLVSQHYSRVRLGVVRVFWATLLTGLFVALAGWVLVSLEGSAGGLDPDTGIPVNLATVLKINLLSLLEALFAFTLLLRIRELALFKRTKGSIRNWYLMIGFMVLAALTMFGAGPDEGINVVAAIFVVLAVIMMVINSFRLSWIIFLSLKEKLSVIGLSLLLIILLSIALSEAASGLSFGSVTEPFGRYYSYPLNQFITLAIIFGILYCVTSLLSLMFHLPTSGTIQKKTGEMAAMHSLLKLVGQVLQPDKLTSTIVASPVEAGTAQCAWLALRDPRSGSLKPRIVAVHNVEAHAIEKIVDISALTDEAAARGGAVLLGRAAGDHRVNARPGDGLGSILVVPLQAREETIGALFVAKDVTQGFEPDDVDTITAFANQAALALDNARLFEEQLEKERLAREMAIARDVQRRLLPQKTPVLKDVSIAASSVSAHEVGGDYYDFVEIGEERLGIIVADVSGKGTSAAFYMAELKGAFQSLSRLSLSPAASLIQANEALAGSLEKNAFISAVFAHLDLKKEELIIARAGHCPVAAVSERGEGRYLRSRGMGLGLNRGQLFRNTLEEERVSLTKGDTFVFFTDGLVESRNPEGEEYGYERLLEVIQEERNLGAHDLHERLLNDLARFLQKNHFDDDLTLVILKWKEQEVNKAETGSDILVQAATK